MSTGADHVEETRKILDRPDAVRSGKTKKTIEDLLSIPGARRIGPNKIAFDCPVSPAVQYIRAVRPDGKRI